MQAPGANVLPFLVVIPLIVWRMYGRIRRSVGRQALSKNRPWFTIVLFPLLTLLLGWQSLARLPLLGAMLAGIAAGVVLGAYGLRHTKFEVSAQGLFYTPNAHIGIAISVLFVARVLYRLFEAYTGNAYAQPGHPDFAASPLTLGIFGLMAGYYVTYAIGLVRWSKSAVVPGEETREN